MKKVTVITLERHRDDALRALRNLGRLHPEPVGESPADTLDSLRREQHTIQKIVTSLELRAKEPGTRRSHDRPEGNGVRRKSLENVPTGDHVIRIRRLMRDLREKIERRATVEREIHDTQPLGDFDPQDIRDLEEKGIPIRLFRRTGKQKQAFPPHTVTRIVFQDRKQTIYAIVGPGDADDADEAVPLPERSLRAMLRERAALDGQMAEIHRELDEAVGLLPHLRRLLAEKNDALQFAETRAGMGQRENIAYIRGYCPADNVKDLQSAARKHGWAILAENPAPDDKVPTFIRHPKWVRPIRAVLDLIGILPGYREFDVSAVFLVFFSLFFAMIVGDAGYGALFLGLTALAYRLWKKSVPPEPFRLLAMLSLFTIAWGLLNGNIFGADLFPNPVPWLADRENMMMLCFIIGAVHLTVAHGWNAFKIINTPQALAQAGWIAMTWTMFLTARALILGRAFPAWAYALAGVGLLLVVLFMTPRRSFKKEWISHAMLPLTVINNFVDVVSYVRLFAVGYATLAVAEAFNDMAFAGEVAGIARGLAAALILFFGHALNIMLCMLSVLVHGIRLNTLEFSSHIGMQWTGFRYRPFAANAKET